MTIPNQEVARTRRTWNTGSGSGNVDFEVDGLVEKPLKWSLDEFMQLPAVRVYAISLRY